MGFSGLMNLMVQRRLAFRRGCGIVSVSSRVFFFFFLFFFFFFVSFFKLGMFFHSGRTSGARWLVRGDVITGRRRPLISPLWRHYGSGRWIESPASDWLPADCGGDLCKSDALWRLLLLLLLHFYNFFWGLDLDFFSKIWCGFFISRPSFSSVWRRCHFESSRYLSIFPSPPPSQTNTKADPDGASRGEMNRKSDFYYETKLGNVINSFRPNPPHTRLHSSEKAVKWY